MSTFLVIYRIDPAAMADAPEPTPEQASEMTQAWMSWAERNSAAIVDFGNPTTPASPGADPSVGGYGLLQADTYDELATLLEDHPHRAMGGTIDVYENQPVPGV